MRAFLSLLCFSLIPSTAALAQPAPGPDPVAACATVAAVPYDADTRAPLMSARVSMASCAAQARAEALVITDDDAGLAALTAAAAPSLVTLADVAQTADPAYQIVAISVRADLLYGMATRMRASIPAIRDGASGDELIREIGDRVARRAALEPKLVPWLEEAAAACDRARVIAQAHPEALSDPAVAVQLASAICFTQR